MGKGHVSVGLPLKRNGRFSSMEIVIDWSVIKILQMFQQFF